MRALHQAIDDDPKILTDPIALARSTPMKIDDGSHRSRLLLCENSGERDSRCALGTRRTVLPRECNAAYGNMWSLEPEVKKSWN
jgi:hypothetical protein